MNGECLAGCHSAKKVVCGINKTAARGRRFVLGRPLDRGNRAATHSPGLFVDTGNARGGYMR